MKMKRISYLLLGFLLVTGASSLRADSAKARQVIAAAVEAMGGKHYLDVKNSHSSGEYFTFDREGRKGYAKYFDWTNLDPVKWRFQLGEGKRQTVEIYNLDVGKGWTLEGKDTVSDAKQEDVDNFRKSVKRDIDILLRKRLDEEGMNLYYYSGDDVAGSGENEAVEFLDSTNQSVIMFFDTKTHLPTKLETQITDKLGLKHKEEVEYFTWHTIQNVHTPLRVDVHVDGQVSQQRFVEKIEYNVAIPEDFFLEPKVEKKKK
ncbi:MAG: hypothetical protein EHM61_02950 [Acidobacteria bacterium]|nr:MAG: hypothetical protein EHM61_02950 [Acidobacteriota bacterium]